MAIAGQTGTYHLAASPRQYNPARQNAYEFVVTGLDELIKVGSDDVITNAAEVLRFSVVKCDIPHFSQNVITIKRGNTQMKFAGAMTFDAGNLVINDYIGADGKSVLASWQALSGDVKNETVGNAADYKKDCWLLEYTSDFKTLVRQFELKGCWISKLSEDGFDAESDNKKTISATVEFDKAFMSPPDDEE